MYDAIIKSWLAWANAKGIELANDSDVFSIAGMRGDPPHDFLCSFEGVEHLVKSPEGIVQRSKNPILVEIRFPEDYLRATDPSLGLRVVGIASPIFHPNVAPPHVCLGAAFRGGTPLHEIVRLVYEALCYRNVTPDEHDAMPSASSREACRYLREHPGLSESLSVLPLRRRKLNVPATVQELNPPL